MKANLKLFVTGFLISFKHSSRRLLCLFGIACLCILFVWGYFSQPQESTHETVVVGVMNLDDNPLSVSMMNALLDKENLSKTMDVILLTSNSAERERCHVILTIPKGFLNSILSGENLSPVLEMNMDSPIATMWISQLAISGARALTMAQQGIYEVLEAAKNSSQYNLILADVNLTFLNAFFQSLTILETKTLSASGSLSLPQYYMAALSAGLLFCYGFLFHASVSQMRRFTKVALRGKYALFFAVACSILLLQSIAIFVMLLFLSEGSFTISILYAWGVLSLLSASVSLFVAILFPNFAICGAVCLFLTLGQALLGGLLIPLPMLPQGFSTIAPFLPLWQSSQLFAVPFGINPSFLLPLCMAAVFFLSSLLLWRRQRGGNV